MTDAEFWKLMAMLAGGAIIPLLGVAWNSLTKKVEEVRGIALAALTKEEFERELKQSLRDRENLQRDVRDLFSKVEATKDLMNARIEATRTGMLEELREFRSEVTGALNSIRDKLGAMR